MLLLARRRRGDAAELLAGRPRPHGRERRDLGDLRILQRELPVRARAMSGPTRTAKTASKSARNTISHERKRAPRLPWWLPWWPRRSRFRRQFARAQSCPAPLADATRLVLVTRRDHERRRRDHAALRARLAERSLARARRRGAGDDRQGRHGLVAVLHAVSRRRGEPIKVEGDKRAPAGIYPIGRSFGTVASSRPGLSAGHAGHGLRRRSVVAGLQHHRFARPARARGRRREHEQGAADVPARPPGRLSDRRARRAPARASSSMSGARPRPAPPAASSMPEPRVEALQDFAADGAVLAILPRAALDRMPGCLPQN